MQRLHRRTLSLVVGLLSTFSITTIHAEDWQWAVTPYAWAISPELNLGVSIPPDNNQPGAEADFSDLLDKLDFAGQIHIEAHKNRYGFMLDLTNLQLSDRTTEGLLEIDTDSSTSVIEGAALFRLGDSPSQVELLLGFRTLMLDLDIEVEGLGPLGNVRKQSTDTTLTDVMAGVRYQFPLADRWNLSVRGDVASGDTDFTWNVSAAVGYRFPTAGTLLLGYRYINLELDNEGSFAEPELIISGPQIGYTFHF
jgi:hypothetical protein